MGNICRSPTAAPVPYFGGAGGFEQVLDLIERASTALFSEVRERL